MLAKGVGGARLPGRLLGCTHLHAFTLLILVLEQHSLDSSRDTEQVVFKGTRAPMPYNQMAWTDRTCTQSIDRSTNVLWRMQISADMLAVACVSYAIQKCLSIQEDNVAMLPFKALSVPRM